MVPKPLLLAAVWLLARAAANHGWRCVTTAGTAIDVTQAAVNDGFCDCADGSDEPMTSACGVSVFSCEAHTVVWTSMVDDGVCDCCDCADEPNTRAVADDGACAALRVGVTRATEGSDAVVHAGMRVAEESQPPRSAVKAFKSSLKSIVKTGKERLKDFTRFVQAKHSGKPTSRAEYMAQMQVRAQAAHLEFDLARMQLLSKTDFGPRQALLPLAMGPCVHSDVLSDKIVRGGSTTVVPKLYQYTVCPFRNVTQREYRHDAWEALEATAMGEAAAGAVSPDGSVSAAGGELPLRVPAADTAAADFGDATLLGVYVGWEAETGAAGARAAFAADVTADTGVWGRVKLPRAWSAAASPATGAGGPVMRNTRGDGCGADGPARVAAVRLACSPHTRVAAVAEDGLCHYDLVLETPFACQRSQLN